MWQQLAALFQEPDTCKDQKNLLVLIKAEHTQKAQTTPSLAVLPILAPSEKKPKLPLKSWNPDLKLTFDLYIIHDYDWEF